MIRINFDSLRKCDDLYNYQSNVFEFENGIVDEVGAFYPMPIKARDLIMQGHYSKPISEYKPDKLTKFNYQSYFEGVKAGYNELLPKDNAAVLEIAVTDIILKYTEVDRVCSNSNAYDFGVAVGRLYHAWVYIADNVDEFARAWNLQKKIYENLNKDFADYLTCNNKDAMIEKIAMLEDKSNKRIAHLIMWLTENDKINFNVRSILYDAIRKEFSIDIKNSGVDDFLNAYENTVQLAMQRKVNTIDLVSEIKQDRKHEKYSVVKKIDLLEYKKINDLLLTI